MNRILGGAQWAVYIMASSIATPIAVAAAFGMDSMETILFIQRTIFVLGIACLIQALIGHRMPINDGAAGLWWGIFLVYASLVGVVYTTMEETMQTLQSGLIFSGLLFIIFAYTGLVTKMKRLFTPTITFVYLVLLVAQLSDTFVSGMLGIEKGGSGSVDGLVAFGSIVILLMTIFFMNNHIMWIKRYSVILSIIVGWLIFIVIRKTPTITFYEKELISFPDILVFGGLVWDSGMFMTSFFLTILLIANMMASLRVMESLLTHSFNIHVTTRVKEGSIASGINQFIAGIFSAIGSVPLSAAAGFVSATRLYAMGPFIIGCIIVILVSLFPSLMTILSAMPPPVAYSVSFAIFIKLVQMAFNELSFEENKRQSYSVASYGLMLGIGIMFIPADSLKGLPNILVSILSNGLITGTIIAMGMEQMLLWRKRSNEKAKSE